MQVRRHVRAVISVLISCTAWKTTYVDLLIQAPSESSGSLVRLLKSIEDADYFGFRRPHLTVELPAKIDPPTWRYLEQLVWPPPDPSGAPHISQVSLRHRIPRRTLTEYEASARLIESFYPVRTTDSHVLLLSPQVELSPLYYHYLMYHLLEYRYSAHGKAIKDSRSVMGFSLELPTHHLDDVKPLTLPMTGKSSSNRKSPIPGETTPFLWQAPNSNAALYFSDKWIELHSFLTARLSKPPSARSKLISRKHPSWLEFLLELMRARGYALLYPGLSLDDESVVTVHDELYQIPEEFPEPISTPAPTPTLNPDEPLTVEYEKRNRKTPPNSENPLVSSSLLSVLPNSGDLPKIPDLPLLSFDGTLLTKKASDDIASAFAETYRSEIGGCESVSDITAREPNSALDLFCHLDEVYDPTQGEQHHGKTGHKDPANGDAIPIEDGVSENEKDSTHPTRHTGYGAARPQPKVQEDSSEETQIEFRAQMERQAKQAGLENQQEKKETDDGPGIDKKVKSDGSEQASPPESHAGLSKQIPKKPVEGLEEEAVQGKSPGW